MHVCTIVFCSVLALKFSDITHCSLSAPLRSLSSVPYLSPLDPRVRHFRIFVSARARKRPLRTRESIVPDSAHPVVQFISFEAEDSLKCQPSLSPNPQGPARPRRDGKLAWSYFFYVFGVHYRLRYFRIRLLRGCAIQFAEAGHLRRLTKENIGAKNEISLRLLSVFVLFLVS